MMTTFPGIANAYLAWQQEKLIGLSENPALSQKLKCSAECVAQRGKGVIVQGDVAVVTEVVVEPDKAFLLKTNSNTA